MSTPLLAERVVTTRDAAETRALAARLAAAARPGDLLCLVGDLGAGKTQFAKGFAAGLGISDTVSSPTFVLMAEYAGRLPLFHLDLYRLATRPTRSPAACSTSASSRASPWSSGPSGSGRALPVDAPGRRDRRHRRRAAPDRAAPPATPDYAALPARPRRDRAARRRCLAHRHGHDRAVIALGSPDGTLIEARDLVGRLPPRRGAAGPDRGAARGPERRASALGGLVVGTGPGRVHGAAGGHRDGEGPRPRPRLPIAGVVTGEALLAAAARRRTGRARSCCSSPPAPSDRVLSPTGERPVILPGGEEPELRPASRLVAVDLAGRAPDDASRWAMPPQAGLAAALLAAGAARLARRAATTSPASCPST